MFQWLRFIQALAEGNTPDAFFAHLPASQSVSRGTKHRHQAGLAPALASASQRVQALQETLHHLYESAQQACTRAEIVRQTAQATREQCQQTRHIRAMMRQVLHGDADRSDAPAIATPTRERGTSTDEITSAGAAISV